MSKIRVLSDHVANQIAAGEVVERPASVAKELVENAIDAGATRIAIDVESGGRRLLKVSDDGEGMIRDDAVLAFERHATSKIARSEDLTSISHARVSRRGIGINSFRCPSGTHQPHRGSRGRNARLNRRRKDARRERRGAPTRHDHRRS